MNETPSDYLDPDWKKFEKVHCWRNYVSEEVQGLWQTLTPELRAALARQAETEAGREEWE